MSKFKTHSKHYKKTARSFEDKTRVWLASDFHFGHNRDFLWGKRGFKSIKEHDDYILDWISQTIKPEDHMIFHGDFLLSANEGYFIRCFSAIRCEITWLIGNHCAHDHLVKNYGHVTHCAESIYWKARGEQFFSSHFPHLIWEKQSKGVIHTCGHSHGNCPQTNGSSKTVGKILDVGVENAIKMHNQPVFSIEQVLEYMKSVKIVGMDHH